ncbi:MDR family MFS transporter [Anoxybacillus rupiensis]|uniref:MDR family MFS transporter n=2 Tax=Bacillales TaxID=1385 RepID=A0ABD5IXX0_9BACL|nr:MULTISPECIES: MDR family MFS transporter [Anoxybacillus]MBS2772343.1 MFS transporter [Anoxybacillus rupiensis]MDE8563969.1 MDR family MFS transporter [Anoxybacillus rupiensis]MED5052474.1 MDR family MFS transporter [Anoxybacillus rupiensis]OQM44475.1 MFS transporter [Anoxybacillus sp. UARK-01]QHC05640.1 DHA2 family efflux MFS transporter permease subunit [Anoxybacillus sp. PDR2]
MSMNLQESKVGFVVVGLLLGILMASMDNTIVSASMPTIVGELNGLDQFIWVTSAYLVATMASMPIFGKLSDMYGRKRFYLLGLTIFVIGSALCGAAQSIVQLSIYRAIQGVGGGSLMPIAFTIIFDIFPPEKRGKMTGLFGAVFGLSSVIGPLLGAYITDQINWRWIFYINLPLGILSLFLIAQFYKETLQLKKLKVDWFGALTLVGSVVSLMFALELGGKEYDWNSVQIISLFLIFAVLFVSFILIERKVSEPIISFSLFKRQLFAATQAVAFFYGAAFIITTVLIPLFVQSVYGGTATNSGIILIPMMLGSVVGSQVAGRSVRWFSYRSIMLVSVVLFFMGMFLLSTLDVNTARSTVTIFMIIAGLGMGCSFSLLSMATQHKIEPQKRGIATSTNTFFRTLGMTIGVTIFGTIQNHILKGDLKDVFGHMSGFAGKLDSNTLLSADVQAKIPPDILHKIADAMANSVATTFKWTLVPILLAFISIVLMGKERMVIPVKEKSGEQVS